MYKIINASDLKRGMNIKVSIVHLPFLDRKLDHDGYHYDTVDGVILNDDNKIVMFGFNKVVTIPASEMVYVMELD